MKFSNNHNYISILYLYSNFDDYKFDLLNFRRVFLKMTFVTNHDFLLILEFNKKYTRSSNNITK